MVSLPSIGDFESTVRESSTLSDVILNDRVNIFQQNTTDDSENFDDLYYLDERAEINQVFSGPQITINTIPIFIKHKSIFQVRQQGHVSYMITFNSKANLNLQVKGIERRVAETTKYIQSQKNKFWIKIYYFYVIKSAVLFFD